MNFRYSWAGLLIAALTIGSCAKGAAPAVAPRALPPSLSVVPQPVSLEPGQGQFTITKETIVVVDPGASEQTMKIGRYLADLISNAVLPAPRVQSGSAPASPPSIRLVLKGSGEPFRPEHYTLSVAASGVEIAAGDAAGLFYGVQTLRQLMPPDVELEASRAETLAIPAVRISDGPRFGWRGGMLDVARHFFSVDDVKRYIDLLALHKINRLHLHLADDQGWRIQIKSWPNLTTHGASTEVGGGPGGFYTQAQYADLVSYAQDRFMMIVPEIDMPGHTNAALASYAELNCDGKAPPLYTGIEVGFIALCVDKDVTYRFIDDVVREISAITPGPYFHVGGDEVKLIPPPQYQQFIERVQGIVQKHGKQMIGWDEIAPIKLLPTTIVQHWRPKTTPKEAVGKGAKIILSPADRVYLDMKYDRSTPIGLEWAARIPVQDAYDWDPVSYVAGVPESAILGLEAPLWSETTEHMRDVEYLVFPRLAAVAELAWTPANRRGWEDFRARVGAQAKRWSALGINFYRSPQIPWQH